MDGYNAETLAPVLIANVSKVSEVGFGSIIIDRPKVHNRGPVFGDPFNDVGELLCPIGLGSEV